MKTANRVNAIPTARQVWVAANRNNVPNLNLEILGKKGDSPELTIEALNTGASVFLKLLREGQFGNGHVEFCKVYNKVVISCGRYNATPLTSLEGKAVFANLFGYQGNSLSFRSQWDTTEFTPDAEAIIDRLMAEAGMAQVSYDLVASEKGFYSLYLSL